MLVYRLVMSRVANMESLGIRRLRTRFISWLLSRKYDGNSFTSGCMKWSTN